MSLDIIILNVPCTLSKLPLAAPALLKGSVEHAGFTCKTIDFNIRFHNEIESRSDYNQIQTYFLTGDIDKDKLSDVRDIVDQWVDDVLIFNPKFIGISVFTYQSRVATKEFCASIKRKSPSTKIVLGGQGLSQGGINGTNAFPLELKNQGLIDYYIKSEGEFSLVELLQGNLGYSGIDSDNYKQIDNLDQLPYPDYSDYQFAEYEAPYLIITGSRGCVRRCTFCDIHQHWDYRYRSGKSIAEEMIAQSEKYKIYDFMISDSLVNGNTKEFTAFLKRLSEYNQSAENKISWKGQYIIKSSKVDTDEHWALVKQSNCKLLWIGVESGSERVRTEMDKKFANKDLYHAIDHLIKYDIHCLLLLIVGYPTETLEDFQETLNLIRKYKHVAGTIIEDIPISDTLSILPGTPLYDRAAELNIILDAKNENNWICTDNPSLDLAERIRRAEESKQLVKDLGYQSYNTAHDLLAHLKNNIEVLDKRLHVMKKMIKINAI